MENPTDRGAWRATSMRSQRIRCEWSELACADPDRKALLPEVVGRPGNLRPARLATARQSETISLLREGSGPCEGLPLTRQARGAGPGSLGQRMDHVNHPCLPAAPRQLLTQGWRRVPPHCAPGSSRTLFSSFVCSGMRQGLGAWSAHLPPPTPQLEGLDVAVGPSPGLHAQWSELCVQALCGAADRTASQLLSPQTRRPDA